MRYFSIKRHCLIHNKVVVFLYFSNNGLHSKDSMAYNKMTAISVSLCDFHYFESKFEIQESQHTCSLLVVQEF